MSTTADEDDRARRLFESVTIDPLRSETPRELVDEELREAGGDPDRIRRDGEALAARLLEHRRQVLATRARAELERRRAAAMRAPRIPREPRDKLLEMLAAVTRTPAGGARVSAMFRGRTIAEATSEEIAVLLEEIEAARLADEDGEDTT